MDTDKKRKNVGKAAFIKSTPVWKMVLYPIILFCLLSIVVYGVSDYKKALRLRNSGSYRAP